MTSEPSARADAEHPAGRRALLLCGLVVLGVQAFAAFGFWHTLDLHFADECTHRREGLALLRGEVDLGRFVVWSGAYSALYGALAWLRPDHAQDVLVGLGAAGASLALFAVLARRGLASATLLASLWATSAHALVHHRTVYLVGAALAFLSVDLLLRGRRAACVVVFALAALVRPEAQAWMLGIGLLELLRGELRRTGAALVALALALALVQSTTEVGGERTWLGFAQHYAIGVAEREEREEDVAQHLGQTAGWHFVHPETLVTRDFGSAASVGEALRASPGAFLRHVAHNLARLPVWLARVVGPFPGLERAGPALGGLLLVLALFGAFRMRAAARGPLGSVLLASPLMLASALLFAPRTTFLLPLALPLLLLAQEPLRAGLARLSPGPARLACAAAVVAMLLVPRPYDRAPRRALRWRDLVTAAWQSRPAALYYPRDPFGLAALLPRSTRLFRDEEALGPGALAFLHVDDAMAANLGALEPAEQHAVESLLAGEAWRVADHLPGVLVLERTR